MERDTQRTIGVIGLSIALLLLTFCSGCNTLLPSSENKVTNKWKSYQHAETAFSSIIPNVTTTQDLKRMGLNFKTTPNFKKLTYLDVMAKFNLDSSVFSNIKLPPGVQEALNKHENCIGYELTLKSHSSKRTGSFWKDFTRFQQTTHTKGWEFTGLLVIVDNTVVYVLTSGEPRVENIHSEKSPLGPFQQLDGGDVLNVVEGF